MSHLSLTHREWTQAAIDALDLPRNPHVKVGIVYVGSDQSILLELTNSEDLVRLESRIPHRAATDPEFSGLSYERGFDLAKRVLSGAPRGEESMIVFVGAVIHAETPSRLFDDWVRGASRARAAADTFAVGCPWIVSCKSTSSWWREASPGFYFEGEAPGPFAMALEGQVARTTPEKLTAMQVADVVPGPLSYIGGSASPAAAHADIGTGEIRWSIAAPITVSLPFTLTYRVKPRGVFTSPITTTFSEGQVVLTDTASLTSIIPVPASALTITGPCAPIVTPTATPTETSIPPSPTETATSTPTATATPAPQALYVPISLREVPCTRTQPADVVLVMDASTSMEEPAGDGRTKLEAARAAAVAFVELLRLDEDDQAAIIAFNSDARIVIGLSGDGDALVSALDGITTASQTCLVCGLEAAGEALQSDSRIIANQPVVILLTDGRSNPSPASEAVDEAARLKADGVVIFTIGLGAELDDAALTAIASKPSFAFRASDGTALEEIYREIAVTLPGPADCDWGRRRADPRRSSRSSSGAPCASDATASPAVATPSVSSPTSTPSASRPRPRDLRLAHVHPQGPDLWPFASATPA